MAASSTTDVKVSERNNDTTTTTTRTQHPVSAVLDPLHHPPDPYDPPVQNEEKEEQQKQHQEQLYDHDDDDDIEEDDDYDEIDPDNTNEEEEEVKVGRLPLERLMMTYHDLVVSDEEENTETETETEIEIIKYEELFPPAEEPTPPPVATTTVSALLPFATMATADTAAAMTHGFDHDDETDADDEYESLPKSQLQPQPSQQKHNNNNNVVVKKTAMSFVPRSFHHATKLKHLQEQQQQQQCQQHPPSPRSSSFATPTASSSSSVITSSFINHKNKSNNNINNTSSSASLRMSNRSRRTTTTTTDATTTEATRAATATAAAGLQRLSSTSPRSSFMMMGSRARSTGSTMYSPMTAANNSARSTNAAIIVVADSEISNGKEMMTMTSSGGEATTNIPLRRTFSALPTFTTNTEEGGGGGGGIPMISPPPKGGGGGAIGSPFMRRYIRSLSGQSQSHPQSHSSLPSSAADQPQPQSQMPSSPAAPPPPSSPPSCLMISSTRRSTDDDEEEEESFDVKNDPIITTAVAAAAAAAETAETTAVVERMNTSFMSAMNAGAELDDESSLDDDEEEEEEEDENDQDEHGLDLMLADDDDDFDDVGDDDSWASTDVEEPRDWDFDMEWSAMPMMPHQFCPLSSSSSSSRPHPPPLPLFNYLDPSMRIQASSSSSSSSSCNNVLLPLEGNRFAMEQGLYLQAVMQLLAERDQVGVEGSIHSDHNIWKKGPLKKLPTATSMSSIRGGGGRYKRPGTAKWKVKYVELRQGNLCYYNDSGGPMVRKTIHIRQADTTVQECSSSRGLPVADFVFELSVQGSPTTFWMASSEEERQEWIRSIQSAMVGTDSYVSRIKKELDLTPHQGALDAFKALRECIAQTDSKEEYLNVIHSFGVSYDHDVLRVPVEWIRDQVRKEQDECESYAADIRRTKPNPPLLMNAQKQLKYSISDFWKKMSKTSFVMNGITLPCDSPRAPARVIGALTRAILEFDKAFAAAAAAAAESASTLSQDVPTASTCTAMPTPTTSATSPPPRPTTTTTTESQRAPPHHHHHYHTTHTARTNTISELQACAFARSILLTILQTKESQPARTAVQYLLLHHPHFRHHHHHHLTAISSCGPEEGDDDDDAYRHVHMDVSFPGEELVDDYFLPSVMMLSDDDEMTGWLGIRRLKQSVKSNRKYYAVLSGSVLNYYEAANPRPIGLRGQMILNEMTRMKTSPKDEDNDLVVEGGSSESSMTYELIVTTAQEQEGRILTFDNENDFLDWKEAIQFVIDSFTTDPPLIVGASSTVIESTSTAELVEEMENVGVLVGDPYPFSTGSSSMIRRSAERVMKGADGSIRRGGMRVIKGAKEGGMKAFKTATDGSMKVLRGAVGRFPTVNTDLSSMKVIRDAMGRFRPHNNSNSNRTPGNGEYNHHHRRKSLSRHPSMQVLLNNTTLSGKRDEPTVQCVVQSSHIFHVVSGAKPPRTVGNEEDDVLALGGGSSDPTHWLTVNVKIYQAFLLMGGPSGRMARGDALVEMDLLDPAPDVVDF